MSKYFLIYNCESSYFSTAAFMARGGDAASALYGLTGEKPEFKAFRKKLRIDLSCIYSDQVPSGVGFPKVFERRGLPMFCKVKNGQVGVIFDMDELEAMDGSVEAFEGALMSKMTVVPRNRQIRNHDMFAMKKKGVTA